MKFFMLDDSSETQQIAPILQPKFNAPQKNKSLLETENPVDFTQPDSFKNLSLEDVSRTAWLGHSNRQGIGNFNNAQAFVKKFNQDFEKKFKKNDKSSVRHIYLIGCETALEHKGKPSLAQGIADQLFDKGFTHIEVHAIANPPVKDAVAMRVKIVHQAGAAALAGVQAGDVQAYLLTKDQDKELGEVEGILEGEEELKISQKNKRSREKIQEDDNTWKKIKAAKEKQKEIESNAIVFLYTSNIKAELDRPENTFIPKQPNLQKKRLEEEQAHMRVVNDIKAQVRALRLAGEFPSEEENLELLIANLEKEKSGDWRKVMRDHIAEMKKSSNFISDLISSKNIAKALTDILNVHPLFEEQMKEEKQAPEYRKTNSSSLKDEALRRVKGFFTGSKESKQSEPQSQNTIPVEPMPAEMQIAIKQIKAFVKILEEENANRPSALKKFFPSAKAVKITVLNELVENMQKLYDKKSDKSIPLKKDEWVALLDQAEELDKTKKGKEKGLMVSRLSSRTINLFQNIRDGHAARGILKPVKLKPGEKYEPWVPSKKPTRRFL